MPTDVCAIVVNWNTRSLLRECLTLLTAPGRNAVQAICVDNGSTDGSGELVEQEFPSVVLVANRENLGFARACNQGIALALERYAPEYIALVNSDVTVAPGTIAALVAQMSGRPEVAAVGPALRLPDGRLQTGAAGFDPTAWSGVCHFLFLAALTRGRCRGFVIDQRRFVGHAGPVPVDWVSGACMIVRAAAIRQVGLLDARFFMYAEDMEWCQRMGRSSFSVQYLPQIEVVHRHGASGASANPRWLASTCALVQRDRGWLEYLVFRSAAAVGLGVRRVVYALAYIASRQERYRNLAIEMGAYARWAVGLK